MSRIDRRLAADRALLDRVDPADLAGEVERGALVVDLRPAADRATHGDMPGAVVVERIHLEWRLDPTSGAALPEASDDRRVILLCNEGYASSLAAADMRRLGLPSVTDLDGGFMAWKAHQDGGGASTHSGGTADGG